MTHFKIKLFSALALLLTAVGCFKDLDTVPLDPDVVTGESVYRDPAAYERVLAKLYAGYAVSGQQGPAGKADIGGIDEGFGQYLRGYWYHQELTTDEAVIGWNDQTIKDFHAQTWTPADGFIYAFYSRVFYQIASVNEFIRETTDERLDQRNVDNNLRAQIKAYRAEARFLRALSYWHALDLFRNPPFTTESDVIGAFKPRQTNASELFSYIESELKAIEGDLLDPQAVPFGRASKAAAWTLLAKLYLNAEVYVSQRKYDECLANCQKVINAGFSLEPEYQNLFLSDNDKSKEIIFPVRFDGVRTRTWGGMTFIIRAGIGGTMDPKASGVVSGWGGTRTTPQFIDKFPADLTGVLIDYNPGKTATYPKLYVPGSHQGFDATQTENSLAATSTTVPNNRIFEGYKYFPDNNTEIQFTQISSNTAPRFGDNGGDGTLETGGAKIVVPQAGFYYIRVNLNDRKYVIEKRELSVYGSATGNTDLVMQWDTAAKALAVAANLSDGSFRFRANKSDALAYGDTGADAILELGGDGINVTSGSYRLLLDLDKPDYTFRMLNTSFDRRGKFYTSGQSKEISDLTLFTDGYAVNKFKNITSDGKQGSDTDFPDTDFPMFRLADVYLMAAEAILRNGGSNKQQAVDYVNVVRERAYKGKGGNFTTATLSLETLLDERGRELYWECHRRTDLVRFGQFTDGTYKWAWKGGVKEGAATAAFRNIFPIPANDRSANPQLQQNKGY